MENEHPLEAFLEMARMPPSAEREPIIQATIEGYRTSRDCLIALCEHLSSIGVLHDSGQKDKADKLLRELICDVDNYVLPNLKNTE